MTAFYQELTALRKSSPLFTLGDGATVMKRVDFRNTGADQQTGALRLRGPTDNCITV